LPKKWISAIAEDESGLLIYVDHTGIFRFINGRASPFTLNSGNQYSADEYIVCFYPQRKGLLWIGSADFLAKFGTPYTFKE